MGYFPFFMHGNRLRVLLVGGGAIAAAKLETLAAAGASVTVLALTFHDGVRTLASRYDCRLIQAPYTNELLSGHNLVVAATDDKSLGGRIAADAKAAGIWVNVVDDPSLCDFIFPAMIRRGPLQVAISTGGVSPVLARLLKQDIEQTLPEGVIALLAFIEVNTARVRACVPEVQQRRLFWERLVRGPVGRMLAEGAGAEAEDWLDAALANAAKPFSQQALCCLPMRSFDPDELTVRQVRLIGKADTILYDGGKGMLPILERYARRDGTKVCLAPEDDRVAKYTKISENGGVVTYLAWMGNPGVEDLLGRLQQYAATRDIKVL